MCRLKKNKRRKARIKRQLKKHYSRHYKKNSITICSNSANRSEAISLHDKKVTYQINGHQMGIIINTVRVFGFRGLQNLEIELGSTTILTGTNNSGKTSLLKALQIAFGNKLFITQDDFHISGNITGKKIIVDVLIKPTNSDGSTKIFNEDWEALFTEDRIRTDTNGNSYIPMRTVITFDEINNSFKSKQYILNEWPPYKQDDGTFWHQIDNGNEKNFFYDETPFFYIDAQRDILEDMKIHNSYLGKMISKIEYSEKDINEIEKQIKELNDKAVNSSEILKNIKVTLKELNTAMDSSSDSIDITPFTKKLRDLNKGLTIYYSDKKDSFSMEYHGMGTRSWSSLLTLKAFITLLSKNANNESQPFFPIIAVEEPEAHLHPNAQKKLFSQISGMPGQKIIATHSPYIISSCAIKQVRSFYKNADAVNCGKIDTSKFSKEELRKISRQVINTRGELFFSKILIFFEGETEEQALPILSNAYFKKSSEELGINFIGVGGYGNYLPFLRVAESMEIPWLILSDAEAEIKGNVKKQFQDLKSTRIENDCIVFLNDGFNFETQLIKDGFKEELRTAIKKIELPKCVNEKHKEAKGKEINTFTESEIVEKVINSKTIYGPEIADAIVESGKKLPPIIEELFKKINLQLTTN